MIAGLDTVTSSFSCIIAWLAQHPAERAWILEDPRTVARGNRGADALRIAGVLRHAQGDRRPVEIGGNAYPAGTAFKISWAAANLDPEAFPDPLTVDLQRNPNKHIGFASGFHRCLGSHLARLELRGRARAAPPSDPELSDRRRSGCRLLRDRCTPRRLPPAGVGLRWARSRARSSS